MPNDLTDARQFALKRMQAERNVKSHIDTILSSTAEKIAKEANGIQIVSSEAVFSQMVSVHASNIIKNAEDEINNYIRKYAKASIAVLGDKNTGATGRLLNSELFGHTFTDRSHTYIQYFFDDVIKIIIAGKKRKLKQQDIETAVKKQYQDPYTGGLIDQANRKGAGIQTPSYGKGIYRSAYGNIVRNAQGTIAIAWGKENRNYHRRIGATGYRIRRGSSYPCPICDEAAGGTVYDINDSSHIPPLHVNCVCYAEYIYEKKKKEE